MQRSYKMQFKFSLQPQKLYPRSGGEDYKASQGVTVTFKLAHRDKILLCTDGLWSMIDDQRITGIMEEEGNAERYCDKLIEEANAAGGRDNITAVVAIAG